MKCTVEYIISRIPEIQFTQNEIWLEESSEVQEWVPQSLITDGMVAMYSRPKDASTEKTFLAWIKTDGDKVYAIQPPRKDFFPKDWELLYDFGLIQGESCRVTSILTDNNNPTDFKSEVCCTNIISKQQVLPIMERQETISRDDYSFTTHGKWIKGIGSTDGVMDANGFEMDGKSSVLIEAKLIIVSYIPVPRHQA